MKKLLRLLISRLRSRIYAKRIRESSWVLIFSQSRANGAKYRGEELPHFKWRWPEKPHRPE